ncbi:MAG: Asp-tRNA(Asn)/Glu-tRNA(Gln) amidotransferase subunit GatC [Coxiella-like endosymbiont]|uniref:Asp-tRNA(Asn)/Glu-tRNA(Gln) amidotransferase subunit GatC n=1 Tax=Coxiella-like endosymbiont TaxID=1592897 RepID=UPI00215B565E|nr:Asp-tRNA(Asn)/Glu-tRNA(Gln) amidotransferase subunit GatC [Coxiella-like endosymbiont]UVE59333.1 Asp-tRNA(Asn)/Glu-tRNA(Gln) amidotransferase subunit GatC [Coxiella-like endosymbiont]
MSILNADDIDRIAHLAKLIIPENKNQSMQRELNKILNLVTKMDEVDTTTVEPLSHPYDVSQPLREDIVTEPNQRALLQEVAPQIEAGLYIVPLVIENEE